MDRELMRIRQQYRIIRDSGIFMHLAYSMRYIGVHLPFCLSLAHYLLKGEKMGFRPNPFFDPAFFEQSSGRRQLSDYLSDMTLWHHRTSEFFDSRWYMNTYCQELSTSENPLSHFWLKGFEQLNNPSERFDTRFFQRCIARDYTDKKAFAWQHILSTDPAAPVNFEELETCQLRFYDSIRLETLKIDDRPAKKYLVFIQSGKNYAPTFENISPKFDVLINYYDSSEVVGSLPKYVFRQNGTKTTAIRKLLETHPQILLQYEAVLFLDDDVEITQAQIEELFDTQQSHALDLLQASLTADSECYFPVLKQPTAGGAVRPITMVEIMMPLISQRALRECGWVFGEGISGWLVDNLLSAQVRAAFGNTVALVGDVVCAHRRAVRISDGAYYKFLEQNGINATAEAGRIAWKYNINDKITAACFEV